MGLDRFAVEWDRRVVGIALRVSGGFAFFSSDPRFDRLDGEVFSRVKDIHQRLQ